MHRPIALPVAIALTLAACERQHAPRPLASPTPFAVEPAPTPSSSARTSVAAPGDLRIVGSETQYDIVLPSDVLFDFDEAALRPEAEPLLAKVKAHLDARGSDQLHVRGYTDAKGDDAYNLTLSQNRAAAVCRWLKSKGETFTNCMGLGERDPVAPNARPDGSDDPAGRQLNRRVTISVVKYPDAKAMIEKARRQAAGAPR